MNDEIENVTEEVTENAEAQTAEEIVDGIELTDTTDAEDAPEKEEDSKPKGRYVTDEELNQMINDAADKRVKRKMERFEREHARELSKYKEAEDVLNAGLGVNNITEATPKLREFYKEQGVELPAVSSGYSDHDIQILAKAEAEEIIEDGYDAMVEEANRLAKKEYANLNPKEKIIFTTLAEKLTEENNRKELLRLGAKEELLSDKAFNDFKKQFNSDVPMETIYSLYTKSQPQKKVELPGSMRNTKEPQAKTRYTDEEIDKLTLEDLDKPGVWEAVRKSMTS